MVMSIHALVAWLALGLAGIAKGDPAATLMWSRAVHLEFYFGILMANGVLPALNLRVHPPLELAYIENHARDCYLIVDDTLLPEYESFASHARAA
jgi:fatty-acyl-CoA synthase